jgi:hypothetical protein
MPGALPNPLYTTEWGQAYVGDSLDLLPCLPADSVDLVVTSPPFALQRQKEYGNETGDAHVDWLLRFAKTDHPKADVRHVLAPYSERMKKLLEDAESFYRPKLRPSGHDISKRFASDNGGAIPSNLLQTRRSGTMSLKA